MQTKTEEFFNSALEVERHCAIQLLEKGGALSDLAYVKLNGKRCLIHRPTGIGFEFSTEFETGPENYTMRYTATPVLTEKQGGEG